MTLDVNGFNIYKESKLIKFKKTLNKKKNRKQKKKNKKKMLKNCVLYPTHHTISSNHIKFLYQNSQNSYISHITFRFSSCFLFLFFFQKFIFLRVFHITLQLLITLQLFTFLCVLRSILYLLDRQIYWNIFGAYYVMRMTIIVAIFRGSS